MCHLQLEVARVSSTISHHSLMYEVLADQTMWAVCGRTAGVVSFETVDRQSVTLDVMPLIGGFLPLPIVRLAKYIPADHKGKGLYILLLFGLLGKAVPHQKMVNFRLSSRKFFLL